MLRVQEEDSYNTSRMGYNVLVAEPSNDTWTSIAHGVRRYQPEATVLRVKDGEQAVRFLFHRGLLAEDPETPDLIVLNAELAVVPMNAVLARLRQHPRTRSVPVLVVSHDDQEMPELDQPVEGQQWLHRQPGVVVLTGAQRLEKEVADAMHRASSLLDEVESEDTSWPDATARLRVLFRRLE
ncbi:MAG: hypothetical protein JNL55_31460 [Steroidobacter sp.]|nr:hypothetical protein [Steroidobacter sp.]